MTTQQIDGLAHRVARLSRRRSLLTIGGALMAATTAVAVEPGFARKKNNKNRKNGGKGKGADCQKREKQRCSSDATACRATLQLLCNEDNVAECIAVRTCCDQCSAGGFLTCFIAQQQV